MKIVSIFLGSCLSLQPYNFDYQERPWCQCRPTEQSGNFSYMVLSEDCRETWRFSAWTRREGNLISERAGERFKFPLENHLGWLHIWVRILSSWAQQPLCLLRKTQEFDKERELGDTRLVIRHYVISKYFRYWQKLFIQEVGNRTMTSIPQPMGQRSWTVWNTWFTLPRSCWTVDSSLGYFRFFPWSGKSFSTPGSLELSGSNP